MEWYEWVFAACATSMAVAAALVVQEVYVSIRGRGPNRDALRRRRLGR